MSQLTKLREQRDETVAAYEAKLEEFGDSPTSEQQAELDALFGRAEAIDAAIAPIAERQAKLDAGAAILAKVNSGRSANPTMVTPFSRANLLREAPGTETEKADALMRAASFLSASVLAAEGDTEAAQYLARAVADQKVADVPGLMPKQIIGPMLELFDSSRPVFSSFTSRPMPAAGKTFTRPQITQHVTVAKNNVEKSESASQKMVIGGTDVTKNVYRGVLDISQEVIDWSDPGLLAIVLSDFGKVYARVSEGEACDALETAASATADWSASSTGAVVKSITDAVQDVYTTAQEMPTTLWLSLDSAMDLAGLTNSDNTLTAISLIKRSLADVGLALDFIIGPQLAAGTKILGRADLIESYEKQNGLLQAVNVPLHGWDVGFSAYLAFFGLPAGFVSLEA